MIKNTDNVSGSNVERFSSPVSTEIKVNKPADILVSSEPVGDKENQVSARQLFHIRAERYAAYWKINLVFF